MNGGPHASNEPNAACETACGHLDSYLSRELPEGTGQEVQRHLEVCPQCAAELAARAAIRAQLQAAVRATPMPGRLEARVQSTLRGAARGDAARPRTGLWAVAAAAAVIVCAALISLLRVETRPEEATLRKTSGRLAPVLNVGLRDHLHCAVFRKYSKQPVAVRQMAADLGPGFADLAPLVQAKIPDDFRVIQGHVCSAGGGRKYIHLIMSGGAGGGKIVSLILTRRLSGESLSGGIHQAGVDRFQVVGFESHDYLAYVISDLDAQQNLQWAANLAPAIREYLAAHAG